MKSSKFEMSLCYTCMSYGLQNKYEWESKIIKSEYLERFLQSRNILKQIQGIFWSLNYLFMINLHFPLIKVLLFFCIIFLAENQTSFYSWCFNQQVFLLLWEV